MPFRNHPISEPTVYASVITTMEHATAESFEQEALRLLQESMRAPLNPHAQTLALQAQVNATLAVKRAIEESRHAD